MPPTDARGESAAASPTDGRVRRGAEQRSRILQATLEVIETGGIQDVSQRRVARQARVSPSAVLYHFGSVEGLLAAALGSVNDFYVTAIRSAIGARTDPFDVLAVLVCDSSDRTRGRALAELELYLRCARDPSLRPIVQVWRDAAHELLEGRVPDRGRRDAVLAMVDGLILVRLMDGDGPGHREVRRLLESQVAPEQAGR